MCSVLPALHILSGCDYASKFETKHAAFLSNPVQNLTEFGREYEPKEEVLQLAESFLTQVIKKGTIHRNMDDLRHWIYFQLTESKSIKDLPPTSRATRQHILRAYYNT